MVTSPSAETTGQDAAVTVPGQHVATGGRLGRDDLGRHPHLVGEVPQRHRQRVELCGDDVHGRYDGRRRSPVGEELGHGGVELLVPYAAWHQQVGVVLAGGEAMTQLVGPVAELADVGGDDPLRRGHQGAPGVEGPHHVLVGHLGLGDQQGDLVLGCEALQQLRGLGSAGGRADVVLVDVAGELRLQQVGVLRRAQHDQRLARLIGCFGTLEGIGRTVGHGSIMCQSPTGGTSSGTG